jgi:CHAT domain-containing protein
MDTDSNAMRNLGFSPLPGTKKEAEELSLISDSNGYSVNSFSKLNASEKNLRAIKSPTILHLATHGFFISSEEEKKSKNQWSFLNENKLEAPISNPMHRSGLALAGAKNTLKLWEEGKFVDPANDGILTAEEASQLDLSETWLTVLSACDTGSGVARAGEGVLGLRRAFAMAGTQNLLLTLWPVDDSFTKDFMVSFYKEALKTGNAPKAMAKMQKEWLIKLRDERSISQAVKLAGPFVLTFRGNPELN